MRVVVDTNILISAALKADSAPRYAIRWVQRQSVLLKPRASEEELSRTIIKPKLTSFFHDLSFVDELLAWVAAVELVKIVEGILVAIRTTTSSSNSPSTARPTSSLLATPTYWP